MLTCLAMMENNLIDFLQARSLNNNWYNQAAETNEGTLCHEMSPVEDSFHSPSCASNQHAAGTGSPEADVVIGAEVLSSPRDYVQACESEELDPAEDNPDQLVVEERDAQACEETQLETHEPEADAESSSSTSSTSSDSESAVNEDEFSQMQSNNLLDPSKTIVAGALLQNTKSKMLHRPSANANSGTLCGIKSLTNFAKLEGTRFSWPKCTRCFKGEVLQTKQDVIDFLDSRLGKASK